MSGFHAVGPEQWPSEEEVLRWVAKCGEMAIFHGKEKAAKEYRRIYTLSYENLIEWLPNEIHAYSDHYICLIISDAPVKFVLLRWTPEGMRVAQAFQFSRDDMARMAINELWKAKKDHSTSTLAKRALKEARGSVDNDRFLLMFGGVMKRFRDEKDPHRPMFLKWWIDERGPPDNKREAIIWELPKSMTVEEYKEFRESKK